MVPMVTLDAELTRAKAAVFGANVPPAAAHVRCGRKFLAENRDILKHQDVKGIVLVGQGDRPRKPIFKTSISATNRIDQCAQQ